MRLFRVALRALFNMHLVFEGGGGGGQYKEIKSSGRGIDYMTCGGACNAMSLGTICFHNAHHGCRAGCAVKLFVAVAAATASKRPEPNGVQPVVALFVVLPATGHLLSSGRLRINHMWDCIGPHNASFCNGSTVGCIRPQ